MILKLPKEHKDQLINRLRDYLESELDCSVGGLAAEALFDHMLELVSPAVYNQALTDARNVLLQRMANLEDDLYALEKPLSPGSGRR